MTAGSICSRSTATSTRRWTSTIGEQPSPSGRCSFTTCPTARRTAKISSTCRPVKGTGLAVVIPGTRRGVWRSLQRRQDRCDHQPHRRAAGAAAECESGSSSLGGDGAGRRTGKGSPRDATCATVYLKANGMRHATGCAGQRQLYFGERPAAALRAGRCDGCGNSGDSLALGRKGDGETAGSGPHLHHHRRQGDHRRVVRRQAVRRSESARYSRDMPVNEVTSCERAPHLSARCIAVLADCRICSHGVWPSAPGDCPAKHGSHKTEAHAQAWTPAERDGRHLFGRNICSGVRRGEAADHRGRICRPAGRWFSKTSPRPRAWLHGST